MLGAIFKLSYNEVGESPLEGGICGSCFFISKGFVVTANHVLNKENFKPNEEYKFCQYWILSKNFVFEIFPKYFKESKEADLTLIKNLSSEKIIPYKVSDKYSIGTECYNEGFVSETMPKFHGSDAVWRENKLVINQCNLENLKKRAEGKILSIERRNLDRDVKIRNRKVIECDYGGFEGMSGGPLIKKDTGEVIGMMSFGFPPGNKIKDKLFAVSIDEIIEVIDGFGRD